MTEDFSILQARCCSALEIPVHSDVLQVILDYIYTDEAPAVRESANVEFICNVLVMADQLLIVRLKEICEVTLTERLTLKNAAELLELAALYNADQLKVSCFQFIGLNMAALLEARSLDVLSEEVLKELATSYRKMIPAMDKRLITPYLDGPDVSTLEYEEGEGFMSAKDDSFSEQLTPEALFKKAKTKAKRKPRKRSDSSGGYILSDVIQSPPSSGFFKSEKTNSVESLQDLLTSDSEGSFAGASSPRDLQSPDFTATFRVQKHEESSKVYSASSITSSPPVTGSTGTKMPPHLASSPKAIPTSRASASSPNWVAVAFSPVSPPAMDLRTIMEIEENIQKCGATPKLVTGTQKPVAHGIKISQKQRKMMALSSKESSGGAESVTVTSAPAASIKSPPKTWATALHHDGEPKSFRDVLRQEQKSVVLSTLGDTGKKSTHTPEVDPQKSARRPSETITPESKWKSSVPQPESSNPWLSASSKNKPSVAPVTFTTIVEEEKKQEAALIRSREKPLALIQIEERAIQDLLVHYQAIDNPEEYITVERSAQGPMATPMWTKH
ncbi:inhibitor of Bruton tyrosine kinase [Anomaloglossus baeobatrachus]|uniref:inhibitor of Bruton tyrosine kinase n=1 Tax=Anomaloglossus baeobatrachus TaxID=238106 RepID=UPI003F4F5FD2